MAKIFFTVVTSTEMSKHEEEPDLDYTPSAASEQLDKCGILEKKRPNPEEIDSFHKFVGKIQEECNAIEHKQAKTDQKTGYVLYFVLGQLPQ